jgi:hypothetical protein
MICFRAKGELIIIADEKELLTARTRAKRNVLTILLAIAAKMVTEGISNQDIRSRSTVEEFLKAVLQELIPTKGPIFYAYLLLLARCVESEAEQAMLLQGVREQGPTQFQMVANVQYLRLKSTHAPFTLTMCCTYDELTALLKPLQKARNIAWKRTLWDFGPHAAKRKPWEFGPNVLSYEVTATPLSMPPASVHIP